MKEFICNVVFTYSDEVSDSLRRIVESAFMDARDEVVELLNPNYEKWNKEFDEEYGKRDDYDIPEYNNFIRNKQEEIINQFESNRKGLVHLYIGAENDIAGWFYYRNKKIFMEMELTNLREIES